MAEYELCIAVADETDLANGHKRKKEGDIITIRPKGFPWGRKEIDSHLIVPFESNKDWDTLKREIDLKGANGEKRKFKVILNDLKTNYYPTLDLVKVRNKKLIYQPFLKASELVAPFNGVDKNYLLEEKDVDCDNANTYVKTGKDPANLIYNKDTSSYINPSLLTGGK